MVQQFQVLRCFSCRLFQVQQVKKSKKWACKVCGEQQSRLKVYGQGSGADCRQHVQKLNRLQGQVDRAASAPAGDGCHSAVCDDDDGDEEPKQSLMVVQEAGSRWNKYLQDNSDDDDGAREEEEGHRHTDHEHYYSHQDCAPATVGKRKHFPYYGDDFYKEDMKENSSKKNKSYEDGNPSKAGPCSSRMTEDMGCLTWRDKPPQTMSDTEGRFKQSTCSTASCLEREMDTTFEPFDHTKKVGSVTSGRDVLPNDEPPARSRLSAQISSPRQSGPGNADPQPDIVLTTSSSVSLQKPILQSHLFQTDEDFDDDY